MMYASDDKVYGVPQSQTTHAEVIQCIVIPNLII